MGRRGCGADHTNQWLGRAGEFVRSRQHGFDERLGDAPLVAWNILPTVAPKASMGAALLVAEGNRRTRCAARILWRRKPGPAKYRWSQSWPPPPRWHPAAAVRSRFGRLDHRPGHPVLHASGRIPPLQFRHDAGGSQAGRLYATPRSACCRSRPRRSRASADYSVFSNQ